MRRTLFIALVCVAVLGVRSDGGRPDTAATFLTGLLGRQTSVAPVRANAAVELSPNGFSVRVHGQTVELASPRTPPTGWLRFDGGAQRPMGFGEQTVVTRPGTVEEFLTVRRRLGPRTWRWRLRAPGLTPALRPDGTVDLLAVARQSGLRIRPAAIFDARGHDITPPGVRFSLERRSDRWTLALRIDDADLPLPYVIDPAIDYPASQYLSVTASSALSPAFQLATPLPSPICTTGTSCPSVTYATGAASPLYYQVVPGVVGSTSSTSSPSTTPDGRGWIVDAVGSAAPNDTVIPAGTWTFRIRTQASGTSTGTMHLAVGLWKVTTSGGAIGSSTVLLDPGSAAAEQTTTNLVGTSSAQNVVLTVTGMPAVTLDPTEHVFLQVYAKQTATLATQRTITLLAPHTNARVDHTAATTRPNVPSQVSPADAAWVSSLAPSLSATFSDPDGGNGRINFRVCADAACSTVVSTFNSSTVASGANGSASVPSGVLTNGATYHWRAQSQDNPGAQSAWSGSRSFQVDATAPATPSLALSESSPLGHVVGTTIYYNSSGSNSGSFTVTATTSDGESGVAQVAFPDVFGSDASTDTSSPYEATYSWSGGASASGIETVTATNGSGLTASSTFTKTRDVTAPSGGFVTYPNGYQNTASVAVATAAGTDAASGIDVTTAALERQTATLSAGSCGTYGSFSAVASNPDTVPDATCTRYRYRISDNVANERIYTSSNAVRADLVDPTVSLSAPADGAYVGGSAVTVSATASDTAGGVASVTFETSDDGGATWSAIGTDTSSPYSVSWDASGLAEGTHLLRAVATDRAGNTTTSATRSVTVDTTPPSASLASPGAYLRATVTLTATATDDVSGVSSVAFQRSPAGAGTWTTIGSADTSAPYSRSWNTTGVADGAYDLRALATDVASNQGASSSVAVLVDNTAPSSAILDPLPASIGSSSYVLTGGGVDAGSGVASISYRYCAGSTCTPGTLIGTGTSGPTYPVTWSPLPADGTYRVRARVTDLAGNTLDSAIQTVTVDSGAPTGSLTSPAAGAFLRGTVTLTSDSADAGSGVATVDFQQRASGGATWTTIASDTAAPYEVAWDTTAAADGGYDLRVVTSDVAGNSFASAAVAVTVDNTVPTVELSLPGSIRNGQVLQAAASDATSGIASVSYYYCAGTSCTPSVLLGSHGAGGSLAWTSQPADGPYRVLARATDRAGNTADAGVVSVLVDNTAPTTSVGSGPPDPTATSSATFLPSSNETSGLFGCLLDGVDVACANGAPLVLTGLADGRHTLVVSSSDAAGNISRAAYSWTVDTTPPTAPTGLTGTVSGGQLTLSWQAAQDATTGVAQYVVVIDGVASLTVDGSARSASVGPFSADDTRVFRVRARDRVGNEGPESGGVTGIPALRGLELEAAAAVAESRGFGVRIEERARSSAPAGTIVKQAPAAPGVAALGSRIALTVSGGPSFSATTLLMRVRVLTPKVRVGGGKPIRVRVSVTLRGRITLTLAPRARSVRTTWKRKVRAGISVLRLTAPARISKPGRYTLRLTARAGDQSITRTVRVRLIPRSRRG